VQQGAEAVRAVVQGAVGALQVGGSQLLAADDALGAQAVAPQRLLGPALGDAPAQRLLQLCDLLADIPRAEVVARAVAAPSVGFAKGHVVSGH